MADRKQLADEARLHWEEISSQEYVFDRSELAAKVSQEITKAELQEFYNSFTQPENMRKLCVQVIGNERIDEEVEDREPKLEILTESLASDENVIINIEELQSKMFLHPVVKFLIN